MSKKLKFVTLMITILLLSISLTACIVKPPAEPGKKIATYVGSYTKYNQAMGTFYAVQIVELYDDNKLEIFFGFTGGVGYKSDTYYGTYTLSGSILQAQYVTVDDNGVKENREFSANIYNNKFRAQIFLGMSYPDDGTNENDIVGLSFYKINFNELKENYEYFAGTKKINNEIYAYIIQLEKDNKKFSASVYNNGIQVDLEGIYEIIYEGQSALGNQTIKFTYPVYEVVNGNVTENVIKEATEIFDFIGERALEAYFNIGDIDNQVILTLIQFYFHELV